jgi:putative SOS response-associated peptidase YedK
VLLAEKDFEPWLSGNAGLEFLKPAADNLLQRWPVSKRVNTSRAPDEDSTLIDPVSFAVSPTADIRLQRNICR